MKVIRSNSMSRPADLRQRVSGNTYDGFGTMVFVLHNIVPRTDKERGIAVRSNKNSRKPIVSSRRPAVVKIVIVRTRNSKA
jgi:hypothetical protein